ncbi:MAG TPA: phage portal protein [Pyrinomonadaceae bacterium]|jgi:hypothetical protein
MGKFADAFQNLLSVTLHRDEIEPLVFEREAAPAKKALVKSMRDGALSGEMGNAGVNVVQLGSIKGETSRLFQKRNVNTLRAYAEYSIWVRAAIDIYRRKVGSARWQVESEDKEKAVSRNVKKRIEELLKNPNQTGETYNSVKGKLIEDYLVLGHGAVELSLLNDLTPYAMTAMDAGRLAFVEGWDGTRPDRPRYAELFASGSKIKRFLADPQVMCLVNRPRSYDPLGLSHVETLDISVRALLEGDDYLLRQLCEPAPNGALNLGEGVTPKQVDETRAQIQATRKAFIVMGGTTGTDYIPFNATAKEMQVLDSQVWFVRQVAAVFQVSTAALRLAVDTSRANTEAMLSNDDEGPAGLLEDLMELESRVIVRRFDYLGKHNLKIDYPIMHRKDEKKQADIAKTQTGGQAWGTLNEARAMTGLPELDSKDHPFANEIIMRQGGKMIPMSIWAKQQTEVKPDEDHNNPGENKNAKNKSDSEKEETEGSGGKQSKKEIVSE